MKHKLTKACEISPKVREIVTERDGGSCIICGQVGIPNAHYIPRGQCGLGIEQNVVTLCQQCHHLYDNGGQREEFGNLIKKYLQSQYENWDSINLKLDKWNWVEK